MKRVRGDEAEAKAVDAEDARAVVAAGSAKASPGTHAARQRVVTRSASDEPVVVAVVGAGENQAKDAVVAARAEEEDAGKAKDIFNPKNDENYVDTIYDPFRGPRECDEFKEEASDEYSEEDSEDMDNDKEGRDRKIRFMLQHLKSGKIPYRKHGKLSCPFCGKVVHKDLQSMTQHATSVGKGDGRKHKPATKVKHAALGVFLRKYVKAD